MIEEIIILRKGESAHGITNHGDTPVRLVVGNGYVSVKTTKRNTESVVIYEEAAR